MKELIYLQTGELRSQGSFIGRVEELIQIPVNHKTKVKDVHKKLIEIMDKECDLYKLLPYEFQSAETKKAGERLFYDTIDIIPEPGVQLYAIFNLKTI